MGQVDGRVVAARRHNERRAAWLYPSCATGISRALATAHELFQHLINGEARRLLPRRELLERGQELANDLLRRHEQEDVIHDPIPVSYTHLTLPTILRV